MSYNHAQTPRGVLEAAAYRLAEARTVLSGLDAESKAIDKLQDALHHQRRAATRQVTDAELALVAAAIALTDPAPVMEAGDTLVYTAEHHLTNNADAPAFVGGIPDADTIDYSELGVWPGTWPMSPVIYGDDDAMQVVV